MVESHPDFRHVIADFEALTADWQRKTDELNVVMSAAGGVEEHEYFTLRTAGFAQISELTFAADAPTLSPVHLRTAVLDAYARLSVATIGTQASAIAHILDAPEIARAMTAAVPQQMRDRAGEQDEPVDVAHQATPTPTSESATAEQVLDWAGQTTEPTVVSSDIRETMSDVEGWSPSYQAIDPHTAQYELEQEIEKISRNAAHARPALEHVEVTTSTKYLTVTVNGSGVLGDLSFRPAFRSATAEQLTKDFAQLYAAATQQASAQVMAHLDESGLAGGDDPTQAMLRRFDSAADELLSRFDRL